MADSSPYSVEGSAFDDKRGPERQHGDEDQAAPNIIALLVVLLILIVLACVIPLYIRTRLCSQGMRGQVATPATRQPIVDDDVVENSGREEKIKAIENVLVVEKWTCDSSHSTCDNMAKQVKNDNNEEDHQEQTSSVLADEKQEIESSEIPSGSFVDLEKGDNVSDSSHGEDEEKPCCAICLSPLREHDVVCRSSNTNNSCSHIFHLVCLTQWISHGHAECPMCRQQYLPDGT